MTGQLGRGESDVAATIMAHCCDREEVFEYTIPVEYRRFWIFFRQPEIAIDIFFIQFDQQMWFLMFLMIAGLFGFMALISIYNLRYSKSWHGQKEYMLRDVLSWSLGKC